MNPKDQIFCAWSGPAFLIFFLLGWGILSGFLPPHSPQWGSDQVVAFYQANPLSIRFGLIISLLSTGLLFPFTVLISGHLSRIESKNGHYPIWTNVQLLAGGTTVITFIFPVIFWAVTAFRPERDPAILQMLNDLAWLPFVALSMPYLAVPISIAIVGFRDNSENPVFPRWACFFNLWAALLIVPGCLAIFFRTGPFAWNGLIAWWLPLVVYGIWFAVMTTLLLKAAKRPETH